MNLRTFIFLIFLSFSMGHQLSMKAQCVSTFSVVYGPNGQVTFISTAANSPTASYSWTFSPGNSYSVTGTPTAQNTYTANGTYTVYFMYKAPPACPGLINAATITITNVCTASASFSYTQGPNGVVNFINTSSGAVGYQWRFGDNTSSFATSPTHTYAANGTYTVKLIATGTPTFSCKDSISVVIIVNSYGPCNAGFTYTLGPNGAVTFSSTSTPTSASSSYTWTFGNGSIAFGPNPTITYTANGTYQVVLHFSTTPSCSDSTNQNIVISSVTLCPVTANFSYSVGSMGQVNFTNTSTGTVSGTTYTWSFGDGGTSSLTHPGHVYSMNGYYQVKLAARNSSASCISNYSITINVNTYTCGAAAFTHTMNTGGNVSFSCTAAISGTNISASWNFGDGTISSGFTTSHTYVNGGTHYVRLILSNDSVNCRDSTIQALNVTGVTCSANSNFSLSPAGPPQEWNAVPAYPWNVSAASWSWGDGATSNTLYAFHQYSVAGTYSICLTVTASCGASSSHCVSQYLNRSSDPNGSLVINVNVKAPSAILQGIEEYYRALPASIYPNPSSGTFNLICNDHRSSSYFITIQDVVGMKVKALSAESIDGELTEKIDLGTCPAGLYFLTITSGTGSATLKIILEK